ncbi:hypothetical protein [Pseudarthrobacter sp. B4EP4b]|uniref:hypothetical protein n=1 Tax=Pseudarthrobacter sp. B4EP4b TaxID=2590664 RepID=UPI0011538421|nr:hypothetical protein [Pseudarthrobacter sp. B4EP4b]
MRTAEPMAETEQVHRLSENLMSQLARGREWATPGVQAALQRAVAGLDTGIETASPRLQALLRRLADELAGGVETMAPRLQEQLKHVRPKAAPIPVQSRRPSLRMWWIGALAALAAGAAVWGSMRASKEEPAPSVSPQENTGTGANVDADLASGRM